MTVGDWFSHPQNWVFLLIALPMLFAAFKVVTTSNIVHAVLYLVVALAGSAALFIVLGAEFVAWTVVLVYIGAVVVLFLFGIMITKASIGEDTSLSHPLNQRLVAAVVAGLLFLMLGWVMIEQFGTETISEDAGIGRVADIGNVMFERYVVPFEVVSFVLLAALIGGIVLARRDPETEEMGEAPL